MRITGITLQRFFILSFIFFNLNPVKSQIVPDVRRIDSITLELYNQQQWDDLISEGSSAIKNGLDYYYLQMRVGIAWYEKKNYRKAIRYFEKALSFNPTSQTTLEYLYYSYLLSGRKYDANRIAPDLSDERKSKIGIKKSQILDFAYFETGPGVGLNDDLKSWQQNRQEADDSIYSKMFFNDNLYYLHGGINFRVHPNISIYQGYGNISASLQQRISYSNQQWPNYNSKIHQQDYYGNAVFAIPNGIKITSAWHLLWINYETRNDTYVDSLATLMADTINIERNEFTLLLSARKDFDLFAIEANASYGDFSRIKTKQIGLLFYYYPFGNLNFYTETGVIKIWDQKKRNDWIFHQMLGFKLLPKIWFEAEATIGNIKDYSEAYAFTVYNTTSNVNYKIEGSLYFDLNKHLGLSLRSRYMEREKEYYYFSDFETSETIIKNVGYVSLIGGIKWTF